MKTFTWKGATVEFSNRYHFNGGVPSNSDNWHLFMDEVVNGEKGVYGSNVTIVRAVGYEAGSDIPVATKNYTTVGTYGGSGLLVPGECAALLRHATTARSTKNHVVFVFSFFHGVMRDAASGGQDSVAGPQKTNLEVWGNRWLNGITAGGITAVRSTPGGAGVVGMTVAPYITHRDFPR